jgi:hypothetical protein
MPLYTIKIFKSWGVRDPERRWSNTYEIESAATSPDGLGATVTALVAAEKVLHHIAVHFLSATVSTWQAEPGGYNPLTFTTLDQTGTGARTGTQLEVLDSNVCYTVRFMAALGRNGRRFYRGCMLESDVESGGDLRFSIVSTSALVSTGTLFTNFKAAMAPLLAGGASAEKLALVGGNMVGVSRSIVNLLPGNVSLNKRNHRYFDKA